MKQPTKNIFHHHIEKKSKQYKGKEKKQFKYGTSKLEKDFAKNFLDKLGLIYVYQYEVKEIGRFYDFAVTLYNEKQYIMENKEGVNCVKQKGQQFIPSLLIEVDGDYFHSNPKFYNESKLNNIQKHNKRIDKLKDDWAGMHCIPLLRIWENDIINNSKSVIKQILQYVSMEKPIKIK